MKAETYKTKTGKTQHRPVITESEMRHIQMNSGPGFCVACGDEKEDGCEPDMRQGYCDVCSADKVYGIEELFMMGLVRITEIAVPANNLTPL